MAGKDNLIPQAHKLTVEEQSAGGKASVEARREKKELRKALEILLEQDISDKKGNTKTGVEAVSLALFQKALKGDVRAFEVLRDTIGQKPIEKVQVAEIDAETINEVEHEVLKHYKGTSD